MTRQTQTLQLVGSTEQYTVLPQNLPVGKRPLRNAWATAAKARLVTMPTCNRMHTLIHTKNQNCF